MADFDLTGVKVVSDKIIGIYSVDNDGFNFSVFPDVIELPAQYYTDNTYTHFKNTALYNQYVSERAYMLQGENISNVTCHLISDTLYINERGEANFLGLFFEQQSININDDVIDTHYPISYRLCNCDVNGKVKEPFYQNNFRLSSDILQKDRNIPYDPSQPSSSISGYADTIGDNKMNFLHFDKDPTDARILIHLGAWYGDVNSRVYATMEQFLQGKVTLTVTTGTPGGQPVSNTTDKKMQGFAASTVFLSNSDTLLAEPETSISSGGIGSYDTSSDDIDLPPLPSLSVAETGLYTIYAPSVPQLKGFSDWLWSTDLLDKLFTDPIQLIVGLYISPLRPTNLIENKEIKIGGKGSGVMSLSVANEYEYKSFGQISIAEYYGNFLDYQSKVTIYLPYVGYKDIDVAEFMDGIIMLDYLINFSTGVCIAFIRANRGKLNSVVYQFEGNIYSQVSLTSQDASSLIRTLSSNAISLGVGVASGNPLTMASGLVSSATNILTTNKNFQKSGSLSMNGGYLSVQKPYLIFTRPVQSLSAGFRKDRGYTSNIYKKLSELSGFTKVMYVDLSDIPCTDTERTRIETMLKDGIYI